MKVWLVLGLKSQDTLHRACASSYFYSLQSLYVGLHFVPLESLPGQPPRYASPGLMNSDTERGLKGEMRDDLCTTNPWKTKWYVTSWSVESNWTKACGHVSPSTTTSTHARTYARTHARMYIRTHARTHAHINNNHNDKQKSQHKQREKQNYMDNIITRWFYLRVARTFIWSVLQRC